MKIHLHLFQCFYWSKILLGQKCPGQKLSRSKIVPVKKCPGQSIPVKVSRSECPGQCQSLAVKNTTRSKMSRSKIVPVKKCPGQKMSRSKNRDTSTNGRSVNRDIYIYIYIERFLSRQSSFL